MEKIINLEIAKLIGEPIDTRKPVPFELSLIADVATVEPGEHAWIYSEVDDDAEYIAQIDGDGVITPVKKSPLGDTELTFKGLNSKLEYVLVNDVLGSPDTQVLARKKEKITRGMDKRELQILLSAIVGGAEVPDFSGNVPKGQISGASITAQNRDAGTGEDLYDAIMAMKHLVEDYGDGYVLLVGNTVKEKIDTFEKRHAEAGGFTYRISITDMLTKAGIKAVKVFGKVKREAGDEQIFPKTHAILVATNSRLATGKPVKFVRRRISPDIAKLMGADVDSAQRAIIVNPTPVLADPGTTGSSISNLLAYGVYGYESIVLAITNGLAIVEGDMALAVA